MVGVGVGVAVRAGPTGRGFDLQEFARWAYVASADIDAASTPEAVPGRISYSTRTNIRGRFVRQMTLNGEAQLARTETNVYPTGGRQVCWGNTTEWGGECDAGASWGM